MGRSKENRIDQRLIQTLRSIVAELGADILRQQQPERILDRIRRSSLLWSDLPDDDKEADRLIETSLGRLKRHGCITQEIKHGEKQGIVLWTITVVAEISNMEC